MPLDRYLVWVCAGCDTCEPLDGSERSRYPCSDSPSSDGAEVVLATEHDALVDHLTADRDRWIRLFNRLEGAVAHWRKEIDKVSASGTFAYDEALTAAHDRVLKAACEVPLEQRS